MKSENDTELRGMASTVAEILTKKKLSISTVFDNALKEKRDSFLDKCATHWERLTSGRRTAGWEAILQNGIHMLQKILIHTTIDSYWEKQTLHEENGL